MRHSYKALEKSLEGHFTAFSVEMRAYVKQTCPSISIKPNYSWWQNLSTEVFFKLDMLTFCFQTMLGEIHTTPTQKTAEQNISNTTRAFSTASCGPHSKLMD